MLALDRVTKRYGRHGEVVALDEVSLRVDEHDFVVLTGPSGAGKSTLLKLMFAAERPDSGRVLLLGRDIGKLRRSSIPYLRRNVGVVFQDFKLLPDRSALENVAIALEIRAMPGKECRTGTRAGAISRNGRRVPSPGGGPGHGHDASRRCRSPR